MNYNYKTTIYLATTCKNASETIERTFESIADQENKLVNGVYSFRLRYHVQDSCSTDGTLDLIKKWQEKFQVLPWCTFSYASEEDKNMYEGVSKGFQAIGHMEPESYMAWLNGDDIFFPECLQNVANVSDVFPEISWIGGKVCSITAQGDFLPSYTQNYLQEFIQLGFCNGFFWSYIQQEGTFFKKKLWESAGRLDTKYRFIGDWLLWQRMAHQASYHVVDQSMGAFRKREGQLSSQGYVKEMHTHTSFKELRMRFLKLVWKTRFFTRSPVSKVIIKENDTYFIREQIPPSKLFAIRTLLKCYHASFIVKSYDTIKKLFKTN